jgi:hypothetical protein
VPAERAGSTLRCPHVGCQRRLRLPADEEQEEVLVLTKEREVPEEELVEPEEELVEPEEELVEPEEEEERPQTRAEKKRSAKEERERKQRKRVAKQRRAGLRLVNLGLKFHVAAMVIYLVSLAVAFFSCMVLLPISLLINVLAGALNLPCLCLCLYVPDATARWSLVCSIVLGLVAMPLGIVLLLLEQGALAFWVPVLAFAGSQILWIEFIKGLALLLERKEVAAGAHDVLIAASKYLFFALPIMVGLLFVFFFSPFMVVMAVGSFLTFMIKTSDRQIWEILLYPTGIPLLVQYINMLSSLRYILMRHI